MEWVNNKNEKGNKIRSVLYFSIKMSPSSNCFFFVVQVVLLDFYLLYIYVGS
jgi:hypothetical protein